MKKMITLLVLGMLSVTVPVHSGETLTVVSDEWCPYVCAPGAAKPGFGVEMMKAIFEPKGIAIAYSSMDWELALKETGAGKHAAVMGGYREDTKGFAMPDEEFGLSTSVLFVKKGVAWKYAGPGSLAGKKVGIIEGYSIGHGVDEYLAKNPGQIVYVTGDNPLPPLMRKLLLGEVDVIFEDSFVFALKQMELGLADKFQEAGRLPGKEVFVAFAPGKPDSARHAKLFDEGIRELRASKKLAGILKKYGIADWKR